MPPRFSMFSSSPSPKSPPLSRFHLTGENPFDAGAFGVSVEVIFYSILDCVAKVWFAFIMVNRSESNDRGGETEYERQYV